MSLDTIPLNQQNDLWSQDKQNHVLMLGMLWCVVNAWRIRGYLSAWLINFLLKSQQSQQISQTRALPVPTVESQANTATAIAESMLQWVGNTRKGVHLFWLTNWLSPKSLSGLGLSAHNFKQAHHALAHAKMFLVGGYLALGAMMPIMFYQVYQDLQWREETTLDNEVVKKRNLDMLPFHVADAGFSVVNFIGWNILHASWIMPCFVASTVVFQVETAYELGKKILEVNRFVNNYNEACENPSEKITLMQALFGGSYLDRVPSYSQTSTKPPTRAQINKAKLMAHRAEARQKAFLCGCATTALVFMIVWAPMPHVAAAGLIAIGAVALVGALWIHYKQVVPARRKAIALQNKPGIFSSCRKGQDNQRNTQDNDLPGDALTTNRAVTVG